MTPNPHVPPADLDRRLDELWERVDRGPATVKPRIDRHLEQLRQQEALVRAAVEESYEESRQALGALGQAIDGIFRLIEIELQIATAAAAGKVAADAAAYAAALAAEIDGWDLYHERLQARAARSTDGRRAAAEEALRDLRRNRNSLAQLLAEVRAEPDGWRARKAEVESARRALERTVDANAPRFD